MSVSWYGVRGIRDCSPARLTYLDEWLLLSQLTHSSLQLRRPLQAASNTFAPPLLPHVRGADLALFSCWPSLLLAKLGV